MRNGALLLDARGRVDHQIAILQAKAARLAEMIEAAHERARHLDAHLGELESAAITHSHATEGRATSPRDAGS